MLAATLRDAARRFGDRPAYVTPEGWSLSYRDLDHASDAVAVGLQRRGVEQGDVIGLVLPPCAEYPIAYLAVAKLGAITAGVNHRLTAPERVQVLERADPRLVIATDDLAPPGFEVVTCSPGDESSTSALAALRVADEAPPTRPEDPDEPVAIVFTSGTTGTPKGALYANRQLAFITRTDVGDQWGTGGRGLSATWFAHLGFMTKLPGTLRRGGTTFILDRWTARAALERIEAERIDTVAGVPTQLALMLRDPRFDDVDLSSVRAVVVGGGPVTPGLVQEARRRFAAPLATRYSCTEAGIGLGTSFDDPEDDAIVSVGRPQPGVELALLDADDRPVPDGEVGAVCLRSPAVMCGYWRDNEATRAAFTADGFVRTGDLGWRDDRGRLRLVGRAKEMYVRGGYNVYPVEVEAVLSEAPGVAAVAVVPRPDPIMGEVGVACVVARDRARPPSLAALRAFADARLARYKLPEDLVILDALPLTAGEKVDRPALAARMAAGDLAGLSHAAVGHAATGRSVPPSDHSSEPSDHSSEPSGRSHHPDDSVR